MEELSLEFQVHSLWLYAVLILLSEPIPILWPRLHLTYKVNDDHFSATGAMTIFIVYCPFFHPSSQQNKTRPCHDVFVLLRQDIRRQDINSKRIHLGGSGWCCFATQKPILLPPQQHEAPPQAPCSRHSDEIQSQSSWRHPQKKKKIYFGLSVWVNSCLIFHGTLQVCCSTTQTTFKTELLVTSDQIPIT